MEWMDELKKIMFSKETSFESARITAQLQKLLTEGLVEKRGRMYQLPQ